MDGIIENSLFLLAEKLGGVILYYPKKSIGKTVCRDFIIKEFSDRYPVNYFCKRYNLTPEEVKHILVNEIHEKKYIDRVKETFFIFLQGLTESKVDNAIELAEKMVLVICEYSDGIQMYIPNLKTLKMKLRNKKIIQCFNGSNIECLCREFELTQARIYEILRKDRQRRQAILRQQA